MKLKCIIVDDEPLAQSVLEKYISSIQSLQLIGKFNNALEVINFLHSNSIDLIFLDINMPELSGMEMLKSLQHPPKIIITTAYSEFAIDGYEFGVTDYLLKPIKFERFLKAVNRIIDSDPKANSENHSDFNSQEITGKQFFLKQDQSIYKVNISDITYIEALGNYLQVFTSSQKIVIRETMSEMEKNLPSTNFSRIHKSYIINLSKIDKISNNHAVISNREIPIGALYKNELIKKLKQS